jgi:hypothetical protein
VCGGSFKQARPGGELDLVDVGTGPNPIPLFCALPRARSLAVWEYAESNVAWLKAELAKDAMRPQWQHFWGVTRRAYGADHALPENPMPALRAKTSVRQGSIFDLPERRWDAATMFFCAESITERKDKFERACAAYARSVKQGGALIAAFLVRPAGYVVADRPFSGSEPLGRDDRGGVLPSRRCDEGRTDRHQGARNSQRLFRVRVSHRHRPLISRARRRCVARRAVRLGAIGCS